MVPVADVVSIPQTVIDASHAVPEVGWPCDRNFSPPVHLQQSKKEGVVLPNRPAHIAAKLIYDVTGRFLEPCTLVGQTQRFHPIAPVVFPRFSVVEICSCFGHRRELSSG